MESRKEKYIDTIKSSLDTGYRLKVINVESNDVLKVRESPDYKSESIGYFNHDASNIIPSGKVELIEKSMWISVYLKNMYNSREGWVNSRYLSYEPSDLND